MKNLHISLPSALFGAVIAFACTVGSGNDNTAIAQSSGGGGRAVVELSHDADGDGCFNTQRYSTHNDWTVTGDGGSCDCPAGFSPVGSVSRSDDAQTVCLEN